MILSTYAHFPSSKPLFIYLYAFPLFLLHHIYCTLTPAPPLELHTGLSPSLSPSFILLLCVYLVAVDHSRRLPRLRDV